MIHSKRYRAPVNWLNVAVWTCATVGTVVLSVNFGRFLSWLGTL